MNRLRSIVSRAMLVACSLAVWIGSSDLAWAAKKSKTVEKLEPSWGMAYGVVLLFIALGMLVICRPGGRTKEITQIVEED